MTVKEFAERFFKVRKCGGCREILDYDLFDEALCPECKLKWNIAKADTCPTCFQSAPECLCMPKGLEKTGALCLRKLYFYSPKRDREPQNRMLYYIKKNRNRRIADFIAKELKDMILYELSVLDVDIEKDAFLVNVPRGKSAVRMYGFDQSELICKALSDKTKIPYISAISRSRGGMEQKRLDKKTRFKNVSYLFEAEGEDRIKGKYAVLFDDVVTTGASMTACAEILKKAGVKGVFCVCMAHVPKNTVK